MKFWFGKKESAQESVALEKEVHADVKEELTSAKGGEVAASKGPEASGRLTGLAGASDSGAAGKGADVACVPGSGQAGSGLPAADSAAKTVEAQGTPVSSVGVAATTGGGPAAAAGPVLKAVLPSGSGAARIRPVLNIKPAAQGAGLASLAAACKIVDRSSVASADAAAAPAEEKESGDAAGGKTAADGGQKNDAENLEKGKSVIESDAAPVRPKSDQRLLYYQLMNGLYDAILILDEKGYVVDCNTRFTDILGYAREDSWDMPIGRVIAGMTSQMLGHLKSNLTENHHIILDARCVKKDGASFMAEVGVSVFSLTRGGNMVFMIRNVDRRKQAMDELRKSHAALEIALSPAFVCDTDGFFVVVNQAFLVAFSIPDAENAKTVRFVDLLPDGARAFLRAVCGEKIREKLQVAMPDNATLTLDVALAPVQNNGQAICGVAGSIMQI